MNGCSIQQGVPHTRSVTSSSAARRAKWGGATGSLFVNDQPEELRTALVEVRRRLATLERVTQATPNLGDTLHHLLGAVETMQLGVTIADWSGVIIYANPAQARMYGAESPEELVGQDVSIFCLPGYREPLTPAQLDEMTSWRRESVNLCKDGTLLPVLLLSDVLRGPDGRPIGVVTTCEDLSDVKEAQTERHRLEMQVRHARSLENLGALTSGVARDLNDSLGVVLSNTGLFLEDLPLDPEGVRQRIVEMDAAVHRLSLLANQLLAYSGQGLQGMLRLDLNGHLRGMLPLFEASAARNVRFRYELREGLPLVQGDPTQLHHVVRQLIANASEALGGEEGEIRVRTGIRTMEPPDLIRCQVGAKQEPGTFAYVEVEDDGPGMDPNTAARIFEPFFSTRSPSRGLGLAAASAIILRHRGAIQVATHEGGGTRFRLFLPVVPSGRDPVVEPAEDDSSETLGTGIADAVRPEGVAPGAPADVAHADTPEVPTPRYERRGLFGFTFGRQCPRCGGRTHRVRSPWHLRPLRLMLPWHSSTRTCSGCLWQGLRLHRR